MSPSIIQGKAYFSSAAIALGHGPCRDCSLDTQSGDGSGGKRHTFVLVAVALAGVKLRAYERSASCPSFPVISSLKPQIMVQWN